MNNIEEIYFNEGKRHQTVQSLISFGANLFKSAYIIENIAALEKVLTLNKNKPSPPQQLVSELEPFIWQRLIDDIKIITCFENVMKSQLIFKNFIVHKIEGNLKAEQENSPIAKSKIPDFKINGNTLTKFTLKVSKILEKKSYYDQLSISKNTRNALIKMNKGRNQLHLLETYSSSFNLDEVEDLKEMNSYIDYLINKLKGSS